MTKNHIHPVFDKILTREDRERLLNQRAKVVWFTGLSGAGKSTLAAALEKELYSRGFLCKLLDGDNMRTGINNNLGFTDEDRKENIRRIAEVCKLFLNCGVITIAAFISPTNEIRKLARSIIGEEDFIEIFVNPPLEVCEQRDTKGLYKKARKGEIQNFTGISAPFEAPENPDMVIDTSVVGVEESLGMVMEVLGKDIEYK
jgi:adenylylsulfate kinase